MSTGRVVNKFDVVIDWRCFNYHDPERTDEEQIDLANSNSRGMLNFLRMGHDVTLVDPIRGGHPFERNIHRVGKVRPRNRWQQ